MSKLVYSKDGKEFFELDDTPENREIAEKKGYSQYMDVYKPGNDKQIFTLPADTENLTKAQEKGYLLKGTNAPTLSKDTEKKSGLQKLQDMASVVKHSGLRGYSLGATEYLGEKFDPEGQKKIEKLREEYPVLATGSEIGGSLLPGPGLAGRVGKAASWAGSKLLKQFPNLAKYARTGQATKGAVTGAGAGTGEAIIQSGLEAEEGKRLEASGEVLSNVNNWLLGAGLGSLAGFKQPKEVIEEGIKEGEKLIPKLREKAIGKLDDKNIYGKKKEDIIELAVKEDLIPRKGLTPEEAIEKVSSKAEESKKELETLYTKLDEDLKNSGKPRTDLLEEFKEAERIRLSRPPELIQDKLDKIDNQIQSRSTANSIEINKHYAKLTDIEVRQARVQEELDKVQEKLQDIGETQLPYDANNWTKLIAQRDILRDRLMRTPEGGNKAKLLTSKINEMEQQIRASEARFPTETKLLNKAYKLNNTLSDIVRKKPLLERQIKQKVDKLTEKTKQDLDLLARKKEEISINPQDLETYKGIVNEIENIKAIYSRPGNQDKLGEFSALRDLKNDLLKRPIGSGGKPKPYDRLSVREKTRVDMGNELDSFIKDKIQKLTGSEIANEVKEKADRLSKLITIRDNLKKTISNSQPLTREQVNFLPSGYQVARMVTGSKLGGATAWVGDKVLGTIKKNEDISKKQAGVGQKALDLEKKIEKARKKLKKKPLVGENKLSTSITRQRAREDDDN